MEYVSGRIVLLHPQIYLENIIVDYTVRQKYERQLKKENRLNLNSKLGERDKFSIFMQ
jgi:hypothetical protein